MGEPLKPDQHIYIYQFTDLLLESLFQEFDKWCCLTGRIHLNRVLKFKIYYKMYTSMKKISKDKGVDPTEFEQTVAQALFDLENTHQELKSDLKDLYINSASEVDVVGNKKAVVIHVLYRLSKPFRKIHTKLVRELEKKFSGKISKYIPYGQTKHGNFLHAIDLTRHLNVAALLS